MAVEPLMSHGLFYRSPNYVSGRLSCYLHCCLVYGRVRELSERINKYIICVLKMNEGLTGLEQHEDE